jgi:hypothetical protein
MFINPTTNDHTIMNQSLLTNDTTINSTTTRFQSQQRTNTFGFNNPSSNLSYINPQAISTPITIRTKDLTSIQPKTPQQQQHIQTNDITSEYELVLSGRYDSLYIYVSRLLAPVWNIKLLNEFNTKASNTADVVDIGN